MKVRNTETHIWVQNNIGNAGTVNSGDRVGTYFREARIDSMIINNDDEGSQPCINNPSAIYALKLFTRIISSGETDLIFNIIKYMEKHVKALNKGGV
jgi:hypothetical protein